MKTQMFAQEVSREVEWDISRVADRTKDLELKPIQTEAVK